MNIFQSKFHLGNNHIFTFLWHQCEIEYFFLFLVCNQCDGTSNGKWGNFVFECSAAKWEKKYFYSHYDILITWLSTFYCNQDGQFVAGTTEKKTSDGEKKIDWIQMTTIKMVRADRSIIMVEWNRPHQQMFSQNELIWISRTQKKKYEKERNKGKEK